MINDGGHNPLLIPSYALRTGAHVCRTPYYAITLPLLLVTHLAGAQAAEKEEQVLCRGLQRKSVTCAAGDKSVSMR